MSPDQLLYTNHFLEVLVLEYIKEVSPSWIGGRKLITNEPCQIHTH